MKTLKDLISELVTIREEYIRDNSEEPSVYLFNYEGIPFSDLEVLLCSEVEDKRMKVKKEVIINI